MNAKLLLEEISAWIESCPPRTDPNTINLLSRAHEMLEAYEHQRTVSAISHPDSVARARLEALSPGSLPFYLLELVTSGDPDRHDIPPPPEVEDAGTPPYVELFASADRPALVTLKIHRAGYLVAFDVKAEDFLEDTGLLERLEAVAGAFNANLSDPKTSGIPLKEVPGFKEVTDPEERARVTGLLRQIMTVRNGSLDRLEPEARAFAEEQFRKFEKLEDTPLEHLSDRDITRLYIDALTDFINDQRGPDHAS